MRSKAPLLLMEQMIMLLVFALAAALCLQVFAKSDSDSKHTEARDHAVVLAQSAAETIRHCGGEASQALESAAAMLGAGWENGVLRADYDGDWKAGGSAYSLTAEGVDSGVPGLEAARVAVEAGETVLYEVEVTWQGEVNSRG